MPRDIEEFLKMAAQRRQQQKQQAAGRQPVAPKPPVQRRPPPQGPPQRQPSTDTHVIGPDSESGLRQQSVSDHVRQHINPARLGKHAQQLGHEVGLADDKLDYRLQQTFDHKVLSLRPTTANAEVTKTTARSFSHLARELLAMLHSPQSVRQAILLSEILRRPEF